METEAALAALGSLAHASRLRVFRALIQAGPDGMAAGRISETTGIPPSSLSFHLKELSHAGMVTSHQQGRFIIYAAHFAAMDDLVTYLTDNCCGGKPCLPGRSSEKSTSKRKAS